MHAFSRTVAAGLLLAAPLLAGCDIKVGDNGISLDVGQGRVVDEWRRTYTLPEGGRFEISNGNGGIEVTPGPGREVEVVVERTVRGGTDEEARRALETVKMNEEVSPDRVRIEAQLPDDGLLGSLSRGGLTFRYKVRVPPGLNLILATGNGGVRIENVLGQIEASTTNGGITAEEVSGSMKATAVNGGIRVEMASVTGDVEVSVTNGGVRLELPADVKGTLSASCVNGGISVDDDLRLQASESSRRQVTGTINGGGPRIVASTVNGGISITARGTRESE